MPFLRSYRNWPGHLKRSSREERLYRQGCSCRSIQIQGRTHSPGCRNSTVQDGLDPGAVLRSIVYTQSQPHFLPCSTGCFATAHKKGSSSGPLLRSHSLLLARICCWPACLNHPELSRTFRSQCRAHPLQPSGMRQLIRKQPQRSLELKDELHLPAPSLGNATLLCCPGLRHTPFRSKGRQ